MNALLAIRQLDQSLWLDFISRQVLTNGELKRRIAEDALRGVTSNPAIFEKAIGGSADYDDTIRAQARQGKSAEEIYVGLVVADVQAACDLFEELYDSHDNSSDGYVSLEVLPRLAHDTEGTIAEGRQLWQAVSRPNVMIKVPATREGLPAIRQLIAEGINVNVTLIFGLERYQAVTEAFIGGLEDRQRTGQPVADLNSVASFFLSRIDVLPCRPVAGAGERAVVPLPNSFALCKPPGLASTTGSRQGQITGEYVRLIYPANRRPLFPPTVSG